MACGGTEADRVMRYAVSGLFIAFGMAILLLPNSFMIRGTDINWGWLALGLGGISLGLDIMKGRRAARREGEKDQESSVPADKTDDAPGRV